jgi:hypothetical protein
MGGMEEGGQACKVNNGGERNPFRGWLKEEEGLSIPPSKNLTDEGMTPRVIDIGLPAIAQEQEGRSKPKKPKTS